MEEAVGEEQEEVVVAVALDSPLGALLSSIYHQTSVPLCTLDQVSIQCCLRGVWEVLEVGVHLTLVSVCLHSSSMDRVDTLLTAHRYLLVELPEAPHMVPYLPWEEAWVLG